MSNDAITGARILLLDLEDSLAEELSVALDYHHREFRRAPSLPHEDCLSHADYGVIFCRADRQQYTSLLECFERLQLPVAIIVVSRQPNTAEWLDALEAGAADYCSPPFEPAQIRWLLDNRLSGRRQTAA